MNWTRWIAALVWVMVMVMPVASWMELPEAEARSGGSAKGGSFKRKSSTKKSKPSSSSRKSSSSSRRGSSSSSRRGSSFPSNRSSRRSSRSSRRGSDYVPVPVPVGPGGRSSSVSGSSGLGFGGLCCGVFFFALLGLGGFLAWKAYKKKQEAGETASSTGLANVDVTKLELGVQAQSRTGLQPKLEALAQSGAMDTEEGLHTFLQEILMALAQNKEAVDYGHIEVARKLNLEAAEGRFQGWGTEARGKYDREVIRRDALGLRETQRNVETENELVDEDGDLAVAEYFVVTLLVGKEGGVAIPEQLQDTHDLDALLAALRQVTVRQLMVVEVIWSPAAESDTMSRDDLSMHYPELMLL